MNYDEFVTYVKSRRAAEPTKQWICTSVIEVLDELPELLIVPKLKSVALLVLEGALSLIPKDGNKTLATFTPSPGTLFTFDFPTSINKNVVINATRLVQQPAKVCIAVGVEI